FVGLDPKAGALQLLAVAVPDHDLAGLDSGLLQALADRRDELYVRGDSAASQRVHLEADRIARPDQFLPRAQRISAAAESLHRAIHERLHRMRIDRGACAAP